MHSQTMYLQIAIASPLRRRFDYLPPSDIDTDTLRNLQPGCLVRVPFGQQETIGVLLAINEHTSVASEQLRAATEIIEITPALDDEILKLILWSADYYHCPEGEALHTALPTLLRQGELAQTKQEDAWQLSLHGKGLPTDSLKRAKKQAQLISALQENNFLTRTQINALEIPLAAIKALQEKGLIEKKIREEKINFDSKNILSWHYREQPLTLNDEQSKALSQINYQEFQISLIDGATGSGKTEIYLQAIAQILDKGLQALILVPEIGLTPQTIARFQRRFATEIATLHSGLNDRERLDAWIAARSGKARIVIGTRSAIFTPMPQLGIIIVDEEHDPSFKQQEGFRYSARDLAAVRAAHKKIPLLLGSATPSLETLHNALQGRYQHLQLLNRAGKARAPHIQLLDIRGQQLQEGFANDAKFAIATELRANNQVLVFLNRRGYAPTLECRQCGWLADCPHCDLRLTVHQTPRHLHCHHCGHQRALPRACPQCKSSQLDPIGQGTERSEIILREWFPETPIIRVDRDSTRNKNAFDKILNQVHLGEPCILVGTQMLAKGHHFSKVTLVVILDADTGLFSTDFRGPERMGQLLLQVAGRAGRAEQPGRVILQSNHTDHPLVQTLVHQNYAAFAQQILQERQKVMLPPFRYLALIRAESKRVEIVIEFLKLARQIAQSIVQPQADMNYLGPLPAMIEKKGDRFRYQLQINALERKHLQHLLKQLIIRLDAEAISKRLRWSIDVDPQDMS